MRSIMLWASLLALLGGCRSEAPGTAPVLVPVPAGEGAAESHLATAPDGTVVMSWLEPEGGGHALRFATLGESGWSTPTTVARGETWFVNWADFPSVVPLSETLWAAHWLSRQPAGGYAYDVTASLSTDGGETWAAPFNPHDDGTATEHGFVTLFPWQGGAGAVWLDGRNMAGEGDTPSDGHAHGAGGMTLRAAVLHPDGTRSHEAVVDDLTCDCCQTDVAIAADGPVLVYRDRSEDEIRDIYAVRATEGAWGEPVRVAADGWRIDGCPVNGPAVAADEEQVVAAWFTGADDTARVRLAWSTDGGATFGAAVDIDAQAPLGRVDVVLLADGDAAVSWLRAGEGNSAMVAVRRVGRAGELGPVRTLGTTGSGRPSGFPQMVGSGARLVLSWTEADGTGTRLRSTTVEADWL